MHTKRKRRLIAVIVIFVGVSVAVGLSLYALSQDINLYLTPSQVFLDKAPENQVFRLGGMVKKGSVQYGRDLEVAFTLTDMRHALIVHYNGMLPDLFREGQGIVAEGRLDKKGVFVASQVLAKHDSTYKPPAV